MIRRRSGTGGADARKVKGNIHWHHDAAVPASAAVRSPFAVPFRGAEPDRRARTGWRPRSRQRATVVAGDDFEEAVEPVERNWLDDLNPDSKRAVTAYVERALTEAAPEACFQFERHGYFVADLLDHAPGKPVFNRTVTLKDSWTAR
jgi:glutaminyl-tRNA synthetase